MVTALRQRTTVLPLTQEMRDLQKRLFYGRKYFEHAAAYGRATGKPNAEELRRQWNRMHRAYWQLAKLDPVRADRTWAETEARLEVPHLEPGDISVMAPHEAQPYSVWAEDGYVTGVKDEERATWFDPCHIHDRFGRPTGVEDEVVYDDAEEDIYDGFDSLGELEELAALGWSDCGPLTPDMDPLMRDLTLLHAYGTTAPTDPVLIAHDPFELERHAPLWTADRPGQPTYDKTLGLRGGLGWFPYRYATRGVRSDDPIHRFYEMPQHVAFAFIRARSKGARFNATADSILSYAPRKLSDFVLMVALALWTDESRGDFARSAEVLDDMTDGYGHELTQESLRLAHLLLEQEPSRLDHMRVRIYRKEMSQRRPQ